MSSAISVIIVAHNQGPELKKYLPAIMEQDYDNYEVIVADMASTDETKDVIESMEYRYPTLHHTATPATARDISLERLAITLGIRAAQHEWVVLTHANCRPSSPHWLQSFDDAIRDDIGILVGAAKYDEQRHTWFDRKVSFFRLWNTLASFDHICSGHAAVRADGCNVCLRRSLFLSSDSFSAHLNLLAGAEELLVNQLSSSRNTAVVKVPEAIVIEDNLAAHRQWQKLRTFYMETRRHQRQAHLYRFKQNLRLLLPWVLLIISLAIWPLLSYFYPQEQMLSAIVAGIVAVLSLILCCIGLYRWNLAAKAIGYKRTYYVTGALFWLQLPFWNLHSWLRYRLSPKKEFHKKFV